VECVTAAGRHAFAVFHDHGDELGKSSEVYFKSVCYLHLYRIHAHKQDETMIALDAHHANDTVHLMCDKSITYNIHVVNAFLNKINSSSEYCRTADVLAR